MTERLTYTSIRYVSHSRKGDGHTRASLVDAVVAHTVAVFSATLCGAALGTSLTTTVDISLILVLDPILASRS
jgi:hypothetical protein